jgi:hypothetical protein
MQAQDEIFDYTKLAPDSLPLFPPAWWIACLSPLQITKASARGLQTSRGPYKICTLCHALQRAHSWPTLVKSYNTLQRSMQIKAMFFLARVHVVMLLFGYASFADVPRGGGDSVQRKCASYLTKLHEEFEEFAVRPVKPRKLSLSSGGGDGSDKGKPSKRSKSSCVADEGTTLRKLLSLGQIKLPVSAKEVSFDILDPPFVEEASFNASILAHSRTRKGCWSGNDVVCDVVGGNVDNYGCGDIGNCSNRFNELIFTFLPLYAMASCDERRKLAQSIVLTVQKRGGWFLLGRKNDNGGWTIQSDLLYASAIERVQSRLQHDLPTDSTAQPERRAMLDHVAVAGPETAIHPPPVGGSLHLLAAAGFSLAEAEQSQTQTEHNTPLDARPALQDESTARFVAPPSENAVSSVPAKAAVLSHMEEPANAALALQGAKDPNPSSDALPAAVSIQRSERPTNTSTAAVGIMVALMQRVEALEKENTSLRTRTAQLELEMNDLQTVYHRDSFQWLDSIYAARGTPRNEPFPELRPISSTWTVVLPESAESFKFMDEYTAKLTSQNSEMQSKISKMESDIVRWQERQSKRLGIREQIVLKAREFMAL